MSEENKAYLMFDIDAIKALERPLTALQIIELVCMSQGVKLETAILMGGTIEEYTERYPDLCHLIKMRHV